MSKLMIVDLDFCQSEVPRNKEAQVLGGISFAGFYGRAAYSVSSDTARSTGYFAGYAFDRNGYTAVAGADYGAAYAAAAAGAGADGGTFAFTSSRARASVF